MALIDVDLNEFSDDEIINHIEHVYKHLNEKQINKLRKICGFSIKENFQNDKILKKIKEKNLLVDDMKLEVILSNIDKYDYLKICEIFEN